MRQLFDSSLPLLDPRDLVLALTRSTAERLALPPRAIVTFGPGDINAISRRMKVGLVESWAPFRQIFLIEGSQTVITRSQIGGPNIAALVEELSSFGVEEFILWGYCGGINENIRIGDVITSRGALREDGISYHYSGSDDPIVYSNWFDPWADAAKDQGFLDGLIWSCDAIYRETAGKIAKYREMGLSGVEMEVASFYSVCNFKEIKGIAFLVVSDLLTGHKWRPGFHTKPFRQGVRKLSQFVTDRIIR